MVGRARAVLTPASPYFARLADKNLPFISSGCALFDCALGGGFVSGRVVNIIGDKSTGKTLQAIEISANFRRKHPNGKVKYREVEAAFDQDYAQALGMPVDTIDFGEEDEVETAEEFFDEVDRMIDDLKGEHGLYILDSLDALTDNAEKKLKIGDGATYGAGKAKMMSQGFRRLVRKIEKSNLLLVVISQIRENIGAGLFGAKWTRSGGKALDFYCSQVIMLADMGKIKRESGGNERVVGLKVRARVTKNKVGLPYREVEYPLIFGYGIDDVSAMVDWLLEPGQKKYADVLDKVRVSKSTKTAFMTRARDKGPAYMQELREVLEPAVRAAWIEIETQFLPKAGKYV